MSRRFRDDFEKTTGGYEWHPWRWALGILGVIVTLSIVLALIDMAMMPLRTGHGVAKRVTNPDNVIFQYEKFHDLCAGIVAKDKQHDTAVKAANDHAKRTAGKNDPLSRNTDESARLHQVADGILLARQAQAEEYNADSRKFTQTVFKSRHLPYRIEDGVTPVCDAQPGVP